ncbi:MAG: serine/threonine-protein kinase [Myxococcota bacterium]
MTPPEQPSASPTLPSVDTPGEPRRGTGTPLEAGAVLADRYRLVRILGRGGMGAVWEAEHTSLGTPVAVKLIKPELADGERTRARFLREARSAAGLRSPHVVQIFDYGVQDDTPYIAMELLEGESLAERLRRVGRLPPAQVMAIVAQVGRAVSKAHDRRIVHRDLKPDNIFIVEDDDAELCKVLDFGIAKVLPGDTTLEADTRSSAMLGTPYYMSPEQAIDASDVDGRSDLWSLAVIAFECVVGGRPFDASTVPALSVQILVDPIPVPSERGKVPPGFDAWFARATQREPGDRFQSARELTQTLAEALGVDAPSMATLSSTAMASRPRARSWWPGAALVLAGVGAVAWWQTRPGDEPEPPEAKAAVESEKKAASDEPPEDADAGEASAASSATPEPPVPDHAAIQVQLQGPAGAEVYRGQLKLATLPETFRVPWGEQSVVLRVVAPGYEDYELELTPSEDRQLELEMKPQRKTPRRDPKPNPKNPEPGASVDDLEF